MVITVFNISIPYIAIASFSFHISYLAITGTSSIFKYLKWQLHPSIFRCLLCQKHLEITFFLIFRCPAWQLYLSVSRLHLSNLGVLHDNSTFEYKAFMNIKSMILTHPGALISLIGPMRNFSPDFLLT